MKNYNKLDHNSLNLAFLSACRDGHLDDIKYLLTSSELKEPANIHAENDSGLRSASRNGHLEVVEYLLISSDLKEHANIHADNDYAIRWACQNGYIDIVKFLLSSPLLTEYANIHADYDAGFKLACFNENYDVTHYLVIHQEIEETESIKNFLQNNDYPEVANLFKSRQLNQSLKGSLKVNPLICKKNKI